MCRFALDQTQAALPQIQRRDEQRLVSGPLGISRQIIEDVMHGVSDVRVAGKQAQVGVKTRRRRIVVSGAEVRVAANLAVLFAPRYQRQLAVRLQPDHAVKYLHARFLQIARPANVGSFIEPRLQFDDHRDFLFRGRFDQRAHDGRIFAGAIERLLDRKHIRIFRRALDEPHDRRIRIVGMVQQQIALAYQTRRSTPRLASAPARAAQTAEISNRAAALDRRDRKCATGSAARPRGRSARARDGNSPPAGQ